MQSKSLGNNRGDAPLTVYIPGKATLNSKVLAGMSQISSSRTKQAYYDHLPTCPVCMEPLGTYGGPSSLPCGHNGCLHCLQQVQAHKCDPVCPLCRTPFDAELNLGPNFDFKDMLEKLQLASSVDVEGSRCRQNDPFTSDAHKGYSNQAQPLNAGSCMEIAPTISRSVMQGLGDEYDMMGDNKASLVEDQGYSTEQTSPPVINARNLTRGAFAIMLRMLQPLSRAQHHHSERVALQTEEPEEDVWADVQGPSAPPLMFCEGEDAIVLRSILELEPPQWVPDSSCTECMQCSARFQALTRGRHHCRLCGGIFCRACSKGKCLMPVKFRDREPQRVCDGCYEKLEPVQNILIQSVSNAAQVAINDVTDWTCMRGWLNSPLGTSMEEEIYKATNTIRAFAKIGRLKPEQAIPEVVLQGAKGLAILTVAKAGMVLTYKLGTGLVVARGGNGNWSPPSAIVSCGLGWGLQAGGELIDFIVVLRTNEAVKAFSRAHLSLGAGLSASAGPLGRLAEADLCVGSGGTATCYTYSCCQGAFVGVSLEGNVVGTRVQTNARFYGDVYLTPEDLLFGSVPMPKAAAPLYCALHDLFTPRGL